MYSITFNNDNGLKNTWTDWQLIPKARLVANPPEMKTHYVDIPGRNGSIDLTTFLTGEPAYENRTGTWEFIVCNKNIMVSGLDTIHVDNNSKWVDFNIADVDWMSLKSEMMEYFTPTPNSLGHSWIDDASNTFVQFPDDPDGYWLKGRIYVKEWRNESSYSTVSLDYSLLPFRFADGHSEGAVSRHEGGVL